MNMIYFDNSLLQDGYNDTSFNMDTNYKNGPLPIQLDKFNYYKLEYVSVELHHNFYDLNKDEKPIKPAQ